MLDCCRHFMPGHFVKKFIDLLAYHKMNVFHWHLTEDEGWRIEIKKYPKLTSVGAWRKETPYGHYEADMGGDGVPHGGFYTQEEIREIVAYASARHVTIVPEIEMPGHSQAAVAAYPELGCTDEKLEVGPKPFTCTNIFNPNEETILFLQDVLKEVMDLFPGPFVHVGGDEAAKSQWIKSASVQRRMREVGARSADELQSYFIQRMDAFLAGHGKRLVGWDEILQGGLAPGATVMSWQGTEGGVLAAQAGHDVVMTPHTETYLNFYQTHEVAKEPLAIGGRLPLERVYCYEPIPKELSEEEGRHILGVQGQLWSEYLSSTDLVEYMAFPRLSALSEVAWSTPAARDLQSFLARLKTHVKRLDILQVRYRPVD